LLFLDGIHITHCYSNTVAIQPCFSLSCVVGLIIQPLQSVDFVQMFQSVIVFWLPLVGLSAAGALRRSLVAEVWWRNQSR